MCTFHSNLPLRLTIQLLTARRSRFTVRLWSTLLGGLSLWRRLVRFNVDKGTVGTFRSLRLKWIVQAQKGILAVVRIAQIPRSSMGHLNIDITSATWTVRVQISAHAGRELGEAYAELIDIRCWRCHVVQPSDQMVIAANRTDLNHSSCMKV